MKRGLESEKGNSKNKETREIKKKCGAMYKRNGARSINMALRSSVVQPVECSLLLPH